MGKEAPCLRCSKRRLCDDCTEDLFASAWARRCSKEVLALRREIAAEVLGELRKRLRRVL